MKKYSQKIGSPPSTLKYTGKYFNDFEIEIFDYDENEYNEIHSKDINLCLNEKKQNKIRWINFIGIHNVNSVKVLCEYLKIDPLVVEDILNIYQRPKIEIFDNYTFLVLKMLSFNKDNYSIESEQISIIIGEDYIITFQEKKGDVFDSIRKRIRENKGVIRKKKNDYLLYALIDSIIDFYFVLLDEIEFDLANIEKELLEESSTEKENDLYYIKKLLNLSIKSILPIKDILSYIIETNTDSKRYFKDIYDHTIQIIDISENLINSANDIFDFYLYKINNKMNSIMKTLTIISTIFIPLTFLAGIYGMNFKYMPELESRYGYPVVLIIMIIISSIMIYIFKKKKWL
ncbi:magnesium/cobalt transporter CorA [Marinitoga litoralis]|jgi:magnesium transporter|uniref:magnesium/cobalt transporter CorA n=1 Tax=Marinitoga litoralis TaxID=570855 RepID=UPI001961CCCC|nr:magnesium/cobalt transporter CorA [Marinitoga litoralis]MBM7559787.1 magnesium transporter [Marinitoga litoralis]